MLQLQQSVAMCKQPSLLTIDYQPLCIKMQVERLERDHQHEAAVARLHTVLETYTDVTRFPK